jgi:hypothetical protein
MPAFFIAAIRSGPWGIARASSSAACASASKSSSGRSLLVTVKATTLDITLSVRSSTRRIREITGITKFELVQVPQAHRVKIRARKPAKSRIGQIYRFSELIVALSSTVGVSHETPLGYKALALSRQAAVALRQARKLPVGHARNDLRQLAVGLLWLEKRNLEATLREPVTAILALTDLRS